MLEINSLTPLTNLQPYQRHRPCTPDRGRAFDGGLRVMLPGIIRAQGMSGVVCAGLFCFFSSLVSADRQDLPRSRNLAQWRALQGVEHQ